MGNSELHFSPEEVASHSSLDDGIWVIYKGAVYDVTTFVLDHPGGSDTLFQHAGEDISDVFHDDNIHKHSEAALKILESYRIGVVGSSEEGGKRLSHEERESKRDDEFIDLNKPLVYQVFFSKKKMTKEYYLEQVHKPRYLPHPARFFANPMLEVLTRTPWFVVPSLWLPLVFFLLSSAATELPTWKVMVFAAQGASLWSFIEYTLHRFLFHVDRILPDHQLAFGLHFLLHGVHHFLPMDK